MQEKPTNELDDLLENMTPDQLSKYRKENKDYLVDNDRPFYQYMKKTANEKRVKLKDMYSFAGISESYGDKLVRMEKHTTNRDAIIRLCIAGHFTWKETDRALKLYGFNELYAKDPRDACIIVTINQMRKSRKYDLSIMDDVLESQGFEKLSIDEKNLEK